MKFYIVTEMTVRNAIFCDVMVRSLAEEERNYVHIQSGRAICLFDRETLQL
jgi:hypothetical protein